MSYGRYTEAVGGRICFSVRLPLPSFGGTSGDHRLPRYRRWGFGIVSDIGEWVADIERCVSVTGKARGRCKWHGTVLSKWHAENAPSLRDRPAD